MSVMQPVVDENGDIILHGRQGLDLILEFYNADGTLRDMTGKNVTFEVGPTVNKTLVVQTTNSQMKLTLTNVDVKAIYAAADKEFVVLDNSQSQPTPVWAGLVYVTSWIE
jgi:hypothetical protein